MKKDKIQEQYEKMISEASTKKRWTIEVEQAGGEYEVEITIHAKNVKKTGRTKLSADDVDIDIGEKILKIK